MLYNKKNRGGKCLTWYNFCSNLHVNANKIAIFRIMYFKHFSTYKPRDFIYYALQQI